MSATGTKQSIRDFDLSDEEPTWPGNESMDEIMGSLQHQPQEDAVVRSPGVLTVTSERPTRPLRAPLVRWREDPERG